MKRTIDALIRHARLANKRRDRVLVIVPHEKYAQAYLFGIAPDGHQVRVLETYEQIGWADFAPIHPVLARYLPPVVIASHPSQTVTLSVPVMLERANPAMRVRVSEFQDVLKKLQVSLWAEHRTRIAEALGVDPIDAVLVAFRVESVRVAGSEVLNPHDLTGSPIELDVLVRFVARDTFERAREATPAPYFADPAWAMVGRDAATSVPVLLAEQERAVLIAPRDTVGIHEIQRIPLEWSPADVCRELEIRWGISKTAAAGILDKYVAGETTGTMKTGIAQATREARQALDIELTRVTRGVHHLLVASDVSIPAGMGKSSHALQAMTPDMLLRATGLSLEGAASARALAAFAEFYYSERYSELNAWLRQRIAWLGSAGSA